MNATWSTPDRLSAEELKSQFENDGYVILKGVLEPEVVEGARAAMKRLVDAEAEKLLAAGHISDSLQDAPFETRLAQLYENHLDIAPNSFRPELHLPELFDVFFHPSLLDAVEEILGDEIRLYPNYTARPKLPDWEGTLVLWHQDGGYTDAIPGASGKTQELRMVNVWSPLVPARVENGCMQFVPGTHKLGVVPHEDKKFYKEIAPEILRQHEGNAVDIELDPGDVTLFHNLMFHRGLPNTTDKIRWSLDWRYQDATQPTLRREVGHLARSRAHADEVVSSPDDWASRTFI